MIKYFTICWTEPEPGEKDTAKLTEIRHGGNASPEEVVVKIMQVRASLAARQALQQKAEQALPQKEPVSEAT